MKKKLQGKTTCIVAMLIFFAFSFFIGMVSIALSEQSSDAVIDTSEEIQNESIVSDETIEVTESPVPSVQAHETEQATPVFQESEDEPPLGPNHPPMDQIPPMPMPEDTEAQPLSTEPEAGIYHDLITGDTVEMPFGEPSVSTGLRLGEGYTEADGDQGTEIVPMAFNDMNQITNPGASPWRMNAKLAVRFGTNWYSCTGTMRDAETVLTAGHCVYDYGGAGWADEIWVYPGYDGSERGSPPPNTVGAYGRGRSTNLGSNSGWTGSGNLDNDIGLVGIDRAVGMLTDWFGAAYGGDCSYHTSLTYHNVTYPSENCPDPGLHNGLDMYYWYGNFDSCPSSNRLQVDTAGGCFNAGWGGMSGSGAYFIVGADRYVHAVASTADRATYIRFCRQWESWVNWTNDTFIPAVRGDTFDIQPLDVNAEPAIIEVGNSTTLLNHLAANPTNGSASDTWTFRVYLSTNENISSADTLLGTQFYSRNFGAMSSVRINMVQVTIPQNTPPGNYWIGVIYDSATDTNSSNDDTDGWDAAPIRVTAETKPPVPNPMTWKTQPKKINTSQIRMVANTASDPNLPIQYYFDFFASPTGGSGGTDSGWRSTTSYTDSGLSSNHRYGYRVKARDKYKNETSYSKVSYEYTDVQTPKGVTLSKITTNSIRAKSTNTPSGLTRGSSGLIIENVTEGANSGWKQNNNYWTSSGLSPNTRYGFRARARNGEMSLTAYSPVTYGCTYAKLPGTTAFTNVSRSRIRANWSANGNPAGTAYFCENTTTGTNSGWTTNTFWDSTGLNCGKSYSFRVKARNRDRVATGWTTLGSSKTRACAGPSGLFSITPSGGLVSSGATGGPFSPSAKTYTLNNNGGSAINWTTSKKASWVSLSSTSGSLAPGATATVTVSINSNANGLGVGKYNDTVHFTNTTNGDGNTTRSVSLKVAGCRDRDCIKILVEEFVTRFYRLCLNREPDPKGLESWVAALLDGTRTGSDVAFGFVFSQEFMERNTSNAQYLTILYEAFFNRLPDIAGWQGWMDALDTGTSREDVLNGFIYATEFAELCDEFSIKAFKGHFPKFLREPVEAFVTRFYQLCLDRDPDKAGLEGWTNNLLNQIQTGADVAYGFIYSQEFINKNTSDARYLTILYEAFFDREPDQPGWDAWMAEIDSGQGRGYVLNGFLGSQEFIILCEGYGITPF